MSVLYDMGGSIGFNRAVNRGGEQTYAPIPNCTSYCKFMENGGSLWESGNRAIHAKCFEGISSNPQNGLRMGFVSQIGTTDFDQSLQLNNPNFNDCYSMCISF